jgi:hypothetical protein
VELFVVSPLGHVGVVNRHLQGHGVLLLQSVELSRGGHPDSRLDLLDFLLGVACIV